MSDRVHPEGVSTEDVKVFRCGPNRSCEHTMDHYIDLTDLNGRVCGITLACSKCGETAFNIDMWDAL